MKNSVFWDVMPCGSYKNRLFGGKYLLHHQDEKNYEVGTTFTPMMEAIVSSETSILTRVIWHHIQEDVILQYICCFYLLNILNIILVSL
jgi:hypothetical protein